MDKSKHQIQLKVRDYELDVQGIVNNSVYQNYLEHARHEMLDETGVNFVELHNAGIDAVVIRAEIDYKQALKSGNEMLIKTHVEREGRLRIVFFQNIYRLPEETLMIQAKITAVCVKNSRPIEPLDLLTNLGLD